MAQTMSRDATFDRIFDRFHEPIQRYCLRRLPVDEVNDAVAEVFLVAWRKISSLPDDMELPWLYGIARNVVRNANRSRRRRSNLRDLVAREPSVDAPGPELQVVRKYEHHTVLQAMAMLRAEDQEILRLKTWEQLSNGAIASSLGISVGAVDMRINRARSRLADAYAKAEGQSGSATTRRRLIEEGGES